MNFTAEVLKFSKSYKNFMKKNLMVEDSSKLVKGG